MKIGIRVIFIIAIIYFTSISEAALFEVNYELVRANIPESPRTIDKKVAVLIFDDIRSDIERSAKARHESFIENADYYTDDEIYIIDKAQDIATIAQQISKMVARHLEYSKLFKKVEYININLSSFLADKNRELYKDYDLVLTGKIKHYYGFYKSIGDAKYKGVGVAMGVAAGAVGGALGGLIEADQEASLPKEIEGYTLLREIKLIEPDSGKVAWGGEVKEYFKETKEKYLSSKYLEGHNSLRSAINKLVKLIAFEYK